MDHKLRQAMKERQPDLRDEAKKQSLQAFKAGTVEAEATAKPSRFLTGAVFTGAVAAVSITAVLLLPVIDLQPAPVDTNDEQEMPVPDENSETKDDDQEPLPYDGPPVDLSLIGENDAMLGSIFNRGIDRRDTESYSVDMEGGNDLLFSLPDEEPFQVEKAGPLTKLTHEVDGGKLELLVIHPDADQAEAEEQKQEMLSFRYSESTSYTLSQVLRKLHDEDVRSPHAGIIPIEEEEASFYSFISETDNEFIDIVETELYGHDIFLKAVYELDQPELRKNTWYTLMFFGFNDVGFVIPGSEGAVHPDIDRPESVDMARRSGASDYQEQTFRLMASEELGISTYIPEDAEYELFSHESMTEKRITLPAQSEYSFLSLIKLNENFPENDPTAILEETFPVEEEHREALEVDDGKSFSYYSEASEGNYHAYFLLHELDGEKYMTLSYSDYEDYNGGIFFSLAEIITDQSELIPEQE
ncbi:hypothetical protein ACFO4L_01780 [Bacillus daqingensis]|uniref:DUF4367 domain-containing protein n=1 Tax=Bacillus daqingensis TaxID=872396 RepID=A0ABV9NPV4_9BACI